LRSAAGATVKKGRVKTAARAWRLKPITRSTTAAAVARQAMRIMSPHWGGIAAVHAPTSGKPNR